MSNTRRMTAGSPCSDCGDFTWWQNRPGEWYMVTDQVWAAAGMDPDLIPAYGPGGTEIGEHEYLCIGCLETRLGRQLTPADFTPAPVNDPRSGSKTPRLLARLGNQRRDL